MSTELQNLKAQNETMLKALRTVKLFIKGESVNYAVLSADSTTTLGDIVDEAILSADGEIGISDKLSTLLRMAVKQCGSFEFDEVIAPIEEQLTMAEIEDARAFLDWVVKNEKTFGWNISEVYAEFKGA